jgi:hypothetical protein
MNNYKINTNISGGHTSIVRSDGCLIPLTTDNTDYQHFKIDIAAGAQLSDANNNVMTSEQANTFLATLP